MNNMAEVNGTDHLVRHEKESKLNGYDNEGYHDQERSEDGDESANDDDRLRIVLIDNGHRPEEDGSHLHNGHVYEDSNGHSTTTVNGTAVIVLESSKTPNSNMEDSSNKSNSSQKPLDTRLHHYVPVEDVDRKILNGSDTTHVTIPEDAVISFTTGRVKVKKSASNNSSERESIPLETMLPSYEKEDKISTGLGEKAELEAELANHKNGLWSEGHHAYSDGPFTNNEKLNGTKSSDEINLPVNNHRKCLSSDESDTSSEQKSTGEKLYFTEDNRKLCPGWRRVFLCGLLLIILAVALLLGVLAATGILLAESESKNTRYESGHSLPSIDSISHAGHSFRSQPSKVPQNSVPLEDASHLPSNETSRVVVDTVSLSSPPTVTSKVPLLNDTSHSQTIVPNALVGEFTITDENFTEDLKDNTSHGYTSLAIPLESELHRIFKRNGGVFQNLKILSFSPGSIKVKFVTIWTSEHNIILSEKAVEIMKSYLQEKHNFLLAFPVDLNSIHFIDVFDECRVQKGGCSYSCNWNYNTLAKTCTCEDNMILLADGKTCGLEVSTSTTTELTSTVTYRTSSTVSASVTEPSVFKISSTKTTIKLLKDDNFTTTPVTATLTNATSITEDIFSNNSATQSSVKVKEITIAMKTEPSSNFVTTVSSISEESTTVSPKTLADENFTPKSTTTQISEIITIKSLESEDNHTLENTTTIENVNNSINLYEVNTTTFSQDFETNTEVSSLDRNQISSNHNHSETNTNNSVYTEHQTETTHTQLNITEVSTIIKETETTESKSFNHSEVNTITPINPESKGENTTINLATTMPSITINETTIGYHIENKTNQVYSLNSSNDFVTETIPLTNIETRNVTNNSIIITNIPMVTSKHTNSKITETNNMTQPIFTTYIPNSNTVTEKYEKSVPVEITKYDTTMAVDMAAYATTPSTITEYHTTQQYNSVTEVINFTNNTMNTYDLIHETIINNSTDENVTEIPTKNIETILLVTAIPSNVEKTSTTNSVLNENNVYETTVASNDFVTTVKPLIIPSFNRTPGIRSFDNFTNFNENSTFVSNIDVLNTAATPTEANTEINTFSMTTSNTNEIPTLSPFTTPISLVESLPETNFSTIGSGITETTSNNKIVLNNTMLNKDVIPITMSNNSFTTLSNNSETLVNIEQTHEFTTLNYQNLSELYTKKTDENHTTVSFHNSKPPTILTTEKPSDVTIQPIGTLIETFLGNVSENITFKTTVIPFYNNSNIDSLNISKNSQVTFSNTEIPMQSNNDTTNMEYFNTTISNVEINSTVTSVENTDLILNSDLPNSTSTFNATINPFISSTTVKLLTNESEIVDSTIVVPLTKYINETEVINDKVLDNTNITESSNFTDLNGIKEIFTTPQDLNFPTTKYFSDNETSFTTESISGVNVLTTMEYNTSMLPEQILDLNLTHSVGISIESPLDGMHSTLLPSQNESLENSTLTDDVGNFTTIDYESVTNETTTNASTGIECREDQFLCESLNKCINNTFMCDGIVDCPDGQDEYECKDTCHSNFMCTNTSVCIMNDARCDGIWDCENGTDEENCTPTECAKHEVMCSDGSKCIRPGDICDWKYNCRDRSDEVGCVERTTCESGGRFFCNDGLCIPWSLKCDGEFDCKEGEDEGNCTCLNDEFRCNDGKCLKSSSRCDGHKDCHDAGDEMGCVNVDTEHIVSTYEPYSGTWGLLCAEDWNLDDGQYLCQEFGFGHVLNVEKVHVSFNGTWMAMRRGNLTHSSLWTERVSFIESCTSNLAARVECQKFACGEYTGLLHRRRRDTISSSSSQWPFIGYASTFHSSRGCLSEILTPIWLITSAECLLSISKEPFNGSDWYVRTNIGKNVEPDQAQNHEVLKIISHPHSSKFRSLTIRDYDVALIRLKHALVFVSDKIGAICPPEEQVPPGITCFSGVLGTEKPRAPPPKSLAINSLALQIIDKGNCNGIEHFNNTINQRMLCTQSSEGHTICDNDEGTPLMCLTGINKWFLAGMLTYQRFCDVYLKHPAVFSNLFSMRKFLDQITGQKQYEIPYDNNVYVVIPPTTPSPTVPETITLVMTTTEVLLPVTTYPTTLNFENANETVLGNSEDINGTTFINEDLSKANTSTTLVLGEITTQLPNVTNIYGNESTHAHYDMKYDAFNATLDETEKSEKFTMNETHHYLMALPKDISSDFESNMTDISAINNSTSLKNETMPNFSKITSLDFDPKNITITSESINDTNTINNSLILNDVNLTTELITPENSTSGFINPKITTDFINLQNMTTDFEQLENSTIGFMKIKNTTDFTYPENSTDFKLKNLIPDDMEFKNITGFTMIESSTKDSVELENSTIGFMKLENIAGFMQHENSTRFMRLENKTLGMKLYEDTANKFLNLNNDKKTNESINVDATNITFSAHLSSLTMNENVPVSQPLVLPLNDNLDAFTFTPDDNNTTEIIQPIPSEMHQPNNKTVSVNKPLIYEENNVTKSETLLTTLSSEFYINTETNTEPSNISNKTTTATKVASSNTLNATREKMEKSIDKFTMNKTNHNLITLPNDTYFNAESNETGIYALNETSTMLNTPPVISVSDLITTTTPIEDFTKNFEILIEDKPHKDLKFSVFNDSKGVKFEHLIMPEMNMNNNFENLSVTELYRSEINTTNLPLSSEISSFVDESTIGVSLEHTTNSLSLLEDNVFQNLATKSFNSTEFPALIVDNLYKSSTTEFSNLTEIPFNFDEKFKEVEYPNPIQYSTLMTDNNTSENVTTKFSELDFTTPAMYDVEAGYKISDKPFTPANDFTTLISEINSDMNISVPDDYIMKTHMSEKLTVIQNSSFLYNISDCGIWDVNSGNNNFAGRSFFMQWPALGFLQMVSDMKICAAVALSSKFVITSLNCLSLNNAQLYPEIWTYISGVQHPNISSGGTQNQVVAKIIPYLDQSMPLPFYEYDVALVKLKDNLKMDNYSKNACVPHEDITEQQQCFTAGWTRNVTDNYNEKQFYSFPVSIVSSDICNNTANFNGLLSDNIICGTVNNINIQACQMDLGSPLFCLKENKKWEIQGTLNFLNHCGTNRPSIFNNIARLRKWIFDVLRNEDTLE